MKKRCLVLCLIACGAVLGRAQIPDDPEGRALMNEARQVIARYHEGQPKSDAVLRIVYFHPSDRDPLPNYAERLERVLTDVSDFYRDGLRRFGIESTGLPLERKDGKLVLHMVRGELPAKAYSYDSGDVTAKEIRAAMKGVLDLQREHVLVIYALCHKEPDGRYVFNSPYYGSGAQDHGLCHAADCELLDPLLLKDGQTKVVFTEHNYSRRETNVAEFNSWYLGGVAHELGHALGLFHDAGMKEEVPFGTALMGGGNLAYRNEVRGAKEPAFLSRVSALHLLSHPFYAGSNRGRWQNQVGGVKDPTFVSVPGGLTIQGTVSGSIPAYAVAAYVWPKRVDDHSAQTFPVLVKDGRFDLSVVGLRPDVYYMRLVSLHVNGAKTEVNYHFGFDASGKPVVPEPFAWPWQVARAETALLNNDPQSAKLLSDQTIGNASPTDQKLLRALRETSSLVELSKAEGDSAWVSDAVWTDATVGWNSVARNHGLFGEGKHKDVLLVLNGQLFDKGLYAHAPSHYGFDLSGRWKTLTATIGLRDGAKVVGSAVFKVLGDGKELYRSTVLRPGTRAEVKVDVTGVKKLELTTEGGEGHNHASWAIWAAPLVRR